MGAYDDIIHLPHPTSARHPRMPMIDRAAQFTPFQALTGYGEAIQETARITGEKAELTEDEKAVLDEKLRHLTDTGAEAVFTYFQADAKKNGGAYTTVLGTIKNLDPLEGRLVLTDGTAIPIDDILEIEDGVSMDHPFGEEIS
ncbi:MAG: YolD-like family protein [Oscillospiraceae bacterium]|nr:YolD-like family protein [Oscillospiraceae bacterium]